MTSEMTQFTVFSRLYQKKSYFSFVFKFGSIVRLCEQIYISTSDVYLWDTYLVAIWILFATSLYICRKNKEVKYAPFLTIFKQWSKSHRLFTSYIWIMYIFLKMSYFKRYWTFFTSKLFQLFPKNLIVIFGGQNWLTPYIVLYSLPFGNQKK